MKIEYFNSLESAKEISLALIDCFYELSTQKNEFFDLDLFEIHLMKHGVNLTDEIKDLFDKFLSKSKRKEEIETFSFILSEGVKNKYQNFNQKLENLSYLYDIIVWIETHTEFTTLKYIDEVFNSEAKSFYKFILFYVFKKSDIEKIEEFSIKNIKKLTESKKPPKDNAKILNLIFQNLKDIKLIIEIFISISKDKDYLKFITVQKKLSQNEVINEILESSNDDEYIQFLLYLITFNPYIIIDDFKINIFKNNTRNFYLFLKAVLYRFEYYKLNQKSPNTLPLFFKYIFKEYSVEQIKKLLYIVPNDDIILFEPLITFVLSYNNQDLYLSILLKIIKSKTDSNSFMVAYGLINLIIDNIETQDLKERSINIFIGNFKNYLTSDEDFNISELKNFFVTINLFLIKVKIKKETREKLFKMNLKMFEKFIKDVYSVNPTLLTISKYYSTVLNDYLKEYDSPKDIDLFISEIRNIIDNDNQIMPLEIKEVNEIDPETVIFNFISNKINSKLTKDFNKTNKKLTIYPVLETEGVIISVKYFKLLVLLKLILVYDVLYPIFKKINQEKVKIKKDKNNAYILNSEDLLLDKFKTEEIKVKPKRFLYHFINNIYSLLIVTTASFMGFRSIIDGITIGSTNLILLGSSIILTSILIDYFLFFLFKKLDKVLFFELKLKDEKKIFYSDNNSILSIIDHD